MGRGGVFSWGAQKQKGGKIHPGARGGGRLPPPGGVPTGPPAGPNDPGKVREFVSRVVIFDLKKTRGPPAVEIVQLCFCVLARGLV